MAGEIGILFPGYAKLVKAFIQVAYVETYANNAFSQSRRNEAFSNQQDDVKMIDFTKHKKIQTYHFIW